LGAFEDFVSKVRWIESSINAVQSSSSALWSTQWTSTNTSDNSTFNQNVDIVINDATDPLKVWRIVDQRIITASNQLKRWNL
jgi:hypothetical protein